MSKKSRFDDTSRFCRRKYHFQDSLLGDATELEVLRNLVLCRESVAALGTLVAMADDRFQFEGEVGTICRFMSSDDEDGSDAEWIPRMHLWLLKSFSKKIGFQEVRGEQGGLSSRAFKESYPCRAVVGTNAHHERKSPHSFAVHYEVAGPRSNRSSE